MVTVVAEFVGGGIRPWYRIDVFPLFPSENLLGSIVNVAQVLFAVSTFYYAVHLLVVLKKEGFKEFWDNSWNKMDTLTVLLSIVAFSLYLVQIFIVDELTKQVTNGRVW